MIDPHKMVGLKQSTKAKLDTKKIVNSESYDSVIQRLIVNTEEVKEVLMKAVEDAVFEKLKRENLLK